MLKKQWCLLQVLDWELQRQLVPHMKEQVPLPGIYDPDFIAANQDTRADTSSRVLDQSRLSRSGSRSALSRRSRRSTR